MQRSTALGLLAGGLIGAIVLSGAGVAWVLFLRSPIGSALMRRPARDTTATESGTPEQGPSHDGDEALLDCVRDKYACVWADVDPEVVDRTLELAVEVDRRFATGHDPVEIGAWLHEQAAVAAAATNPDGARFRLEGGRPFWVASDRGFPRPEPPQGAGIAWPGSEPEPEVELAALRPRGLRPAIVGEDPETKRALVLSPHEPEFPTTHTSEIAEVLADTRGYAGNVDVVMNDSLEQPTVTMADFAGWDAYDAVHVLTHGVQVCEEAGCFTMVSVGPIGRQEAIRRGADVTEQLSRDIRGQQGVGVGYARARGEYFLVLESDWFRATYPGGLNDTIVWMNGCSTARGDDLSTALAGDGGVFVGWDDTALASAAEEAALAFWAHLSETGDVTEDAMAVLADAGLDHVTGSHYRPEGPETWELRDGEWERRRAYAEQPIDARAHRVEGTELRLREVVELQHPRSGERLPAPASLFVRREDTDRLPVRIRVDGVRDTDVGTTVVRLVVNGLTMFETALDAPPRGPDPDLNISAVDDGSYLVTGEVGLPFRIEGDGESLQLRTEIESLPEGGRTLHETGQWATARLELEVEATVAQHDPGGPQMPALELEALGSGHGVLEPIDPLNDGALLAGEVPIGFDRLSLFIDLSPQAPPLTCELVGAESGVILHVRELDISRRGQELEAALRLVADPGTGDGAPPEPAPPLLEGIPDVSDGGGGFAVIGGEGGCEGGLPGIDFSRMPGMQWWAGFVAFQEHRWIDEGVLAFDDWESVNDRDVLLVWEDEVELRGRDRCGASTCTLETTFHLRTPDPAG